MNYYYNYYFDVFVYIYIYIFFLGYYTFALQTRLCVKGCLKEQKTKSVREESVWVGSLKFFFGEFAKRAVRRKNRVEVRYRRRDHYVEEG